MVTANDTILPSHLRFGMFGLSLCIIYLITLFHKK